VIEQQRPECPSCGSADAVYPHGEEEWWCAFCNHLFDTPPDKEREET